MQNHFAQFLLPVKFDIDLNELEKKYFSFQTEFHPDKAGTGEIENSIAFNQAYEILKNPLRRAIHILQLNGINLEDDSKAIKPDPATLEQVLEIQESIIDLDKIERKNLQKNLSNSIKLLIEQAVSSLESKDYQAAAQILIRAKYFDKTWRDLKK